MVSKMTILYGIKNCDTVKKAKKWLDGHDISYQFHDFKSDGLDKDLLQQFTNKQPLSVLLNKRSTTYRNLSDDIKNNLTEQVIVEQILAQPTLLKRPLLASDNNLTVGFKEEEYQQLFTNDET